MAKQESKPVWISEEEASGMMSMKPATFRRYVRERKLPGINSSKVSWKTYLYNKTDIEDYIMSCSTYTKEKATLARVANY